MTKKCFPYVRFSSTRQEDGSTRTRQNELIDAFVTKHGLDVDRHLEDAGTSAHRGKNAGAEGVLGQFLRQVRMGEIDKGSYLLIENFDRLSRDKIVRSNKIFTDLLYAGIKIVILDKNKIYDAENLDFGDWISALVEFERANAESERKSDFSSKAWKFNREKMRNGEIVTKKVPGWLKVENNAFVIDYLKVERINTLFKLSLSKGLQEATREYNDLYSEKLAIHQTQYLLSNRKLIGEHSPQKIHYDDAGQLKRKDEGDPIPNYYPAVVDEKLFYQVQEVIKARRPFAGRYSGQRYNVFRDLILCFHCNGTMRYMNKGERDYFLCTNSMTGKCHIPANYGQLSIRGKKLFGLFFAFTDGLNVSALLEENTQAEELKAETMKMKAKRDQITSRLEDFKAEVKTMIMDGKTIPSTYNELISDLESNRTHIDQELEQKTKELDQIYMSEKSFSGLKDNDIASIIYDRSEESVEKRVRYNNELKKIIKKIKVNCLMVSMQVEFFNGVTRFIMENEGNEAPLMMEHNFEESAKIMYAASKNYIPK
ncbi:recombinase family protein [Pseudomonas sp.]|uniref:recombinase family protein n=1 Tax=Pseudomonas sp. TaxID=306 RepID=UPI00248A521C|nr:recombinase family protein [Pseudomonas sp.]MDI1333231.1 recombinase family protein [Pseudomonas sp.]